MSISFYKKVRICYTHQRRDKIYSTKRFRTVFLELLFLRFTTLSATGLGDILPIDSAARVLVMLEQFAGIAYLAMVVSRLIGMTIVRHKREIE